MMQKYLLALVCAFVSTSLVAQTQISGTVIDDTGPLPGVNITIKGTTEGTTTDFDGNYTIEVDPNDVLVFSYLGFDNQEVTVGSQSIIDVTMSAGALQLQDVVVTALGFKEKRDNMSSTYSKIEGDKVVQKGQNKVIDGIAGKASGVRISAASGDPGAGANIQIRGQSTLTGETQPLIVVDGVPLNNDWLRGEASDDDAGTSQQSRLNDINPDDIESFQIYKGASAGALYGTRAMNGVIIITTKRGTEGKPKIEISSGYSIDQISYKHPLQTTYGQGINGNYSPTSAFSWGDKIGERSGAADEVNTSGQFFQSLVSDNIIYPITQKNSTDVYTDANFDKVFQDGFTWDNKVSVSGGGSKGTYYFSGGRVNQEGIIKSTNYKKTNFTAAFTQNLTDNFKMDIKANYIGSGSNRAQQGSNTAGVYLGLLRNPADFDISDYIGNHVSSGGLVTAQRHRSYRRYLGNSDNAIYNNPLWTINEQLGKADVNRFIGTASFNYQFPFNLGITLRGGADYYADHRTYFFPYYTAGANRRFGLLQDETIHSKEYNMDIISNYSMDISEGVLANFIVGFGLNERKRKRDYADADNFLANFRGLFDPNELSAKENIGAEIGRTNRSNIRFYGTANFNLFEEVFITAGGALENHSTLKDNFFYPTAEIGWNFINRFKNKGALTFGKLRLAYGQVGNIPEPHRVRTTYEVGEYSTFSDNITLEAFGGGYQFDERVGNNDLQPEIKTEYEAGIDLRFHRNRIRVSGTYYFNETKDALLPLTLSPSLGFTEIYGNGATIENKGWEADLGFTFFRNDDWDMEVYATFNSNKNEVTELVGGGVLNLTVGSSVQSVAIQDHAIGVFYTQGALRDDAGNLVLDERGFPQVDLGGNLIVGDPNPDWRGGFGFNGSWKDLSVGVLFETSQGNDFAERTRFITTYFGTHADSDRETTLTTDLVNYAGNIIPAGTTVRGEVQNFGGGDVLVDESYYRTLYGFGDGKLNEFAVTDGSWTRLREVSINYSIKNPGLGLRSIDLGLSGRNLALWAKEVVGIDPDVNQFGVGLGQGLDYFSNPGTKSYSFNVKLTF